MNKTAEILQRGMRYGPNSSLKRMAGSMPRGKRVEAENALRAALAIHEKLALDFPVVRNHTTCQEDLAHTHYKLGELLRITGKFNDAERALDKAVTIQERLVAEYPAVPVYRRDLSLSHNELGVALMEDPRRSKDAEASLLRAVKLIERLLADAADSVSIAVGLGGTYCNLGMVLRDRGDLTAALTWYERAVQVLEPAHQKEPQREQAKRFLRNSHWGQASTLARLGRHKEALPVWERALALADDGTRDRIRLPRAVTLARLHDTDRAAAEADALAQAMNPRADFLYELARVYALCAATPATTSAQAETFAVRAVELLRLAAATGFSDWRRLVKDADFNAVRQRDDFRKLRPSDN